MTPPLKSISEERAACIAAFESNPKATFAWCCHHSVLIETLTEPFMARIEYIDTDKPEGERAIRLRNFRPVRVELPEEVRKAQDAYWKAEDARRKAKDACDKAKDAYWKAWDAYEKAEDACWKAHDAYGKAEDACDKARDSRLKALSSWVEASAVHDNDWPDNTWNGKSIFESGR